MLSDAGDDRTGANPTVGGFVGVIIVKSAAGGVRAVSASRAARRAESVTASLI